MVDDVLAAAPTRSGSSFEELLEMLQPHGINAHSSPQRDESFRWHADIAIGAELDVVRADLSAGWDWRYSYENSAGELAIGVLNAGNAEMLIAGKSIQRTPSEIAIVPLPTMQAQRVEAVDGRYSSVTLTLHTGAVTKVLSATFGSTALEDLNLTPIVDLSTGVGQTLLQLVRTSTTGLYDGILARSPKASALLSEAAIQLILENVPHRLTDRLSRHPLDAPPRYIRRAVEHMRANPHLPLTISDIAATVGVSSRLLQLGFRKVHGTTPVAYLRQIRLEAIHDELSRPENMLPVSEVALKWGFTHMGRFAAVYRSAFGLYPSDTVRRARGFCS
ncbi:AraC family transcriptional regulator [Bradyrhizobium pachyrhizi]|nr:MULTISPECIES: AraC family transcriptional regulator [Bradyrhizobium]WFU59830.1 AraC family transcriptional regulator [Bradyrhizobium pachyrhizi]WOH83650.1 AraC family transcriptional regulator [Bradyrhizobium sp. BEA-2-5]